MTVIDFRSHYPLAYPLKSHTAMDVVKCLVEVFSHYGFPDELLSDCGTEFLSQTIQAFLVECRIGQIKASPERRPPINQKDLVKGRSVGSCKVHQHSLIDFVLSFRDRIRTSVEIGNEMEETAKRRVMTGSPEMCRMKLVSKYYCYCH